MINNHNTNSNVVTTYCCYISAINYQSTIETVLRKIRQTVNKLSFKIKLYIYIILSLSIYRLIFSLLNAEMYKIIIDNYYYIIYSVAKILEID